MTLINTKEAFAQLDKLNPGQVKEFIPSYFERIFIKGEQISRTGGGTSGSGTIITQLYQVPTGKTLFITGVVMAVQTTAATAGTAPNQVFMISNTTTATGGSFYLTNAVGQADNLSSTLSFTPYLPLKAAAGQYILTYNAANDNELLGNCSFVGILIDNSFL